MSLTHSHSEQPEGPDDFGCIFLTKAFFGKYLNEKCLSDANQQLSFKYFVNFRFIPKLFSKIGEKQATISGGTTKY